ncbi:L-cystine-binding protein TcyK [Synergistales bacterium]|nr:L-cystine-binding protein TcyK [Synergistales bacterium]
MKRFISGILSVLLVLGFVFSGAAYAAAREVFVGIGNAFEPYAFIDEKGEPAGYDVAVLQEVDKRLPQYEFKFDSVEFTNLLLGVDAGKYDIVSQQFEKNPQRAEKYLFANEGFANYDKHIVVKKGRADIKTIDDLAGKTLSVTNGSASASIAQEYNEKHEKKININFDGANQVVYDNIVNDRIDAGVMTRRVWKRTNDAFGGGLGIVDGLYSKSDAYFIYAKKETQLRDDIDAAIKEIKKDGTLTKLSVQYTGADWNAE